MLNYKNIIFDFGNVLAAFDEDYILGKFCPSPEDIPVMKNAVFYDWSKLDEGTVDYDAYARQTMALVPEYLRSNIKDFFENWHRYLKPITPIWALVHKLKEMDVPIYILSNAPTHFAEHANYYEIVQKFDGVVFSAPLVMAKPELRIYQHLFNTYHLCPGECLFIDDRADNIAAGESLGMDGIVFTGDMEAVYKKIGLSRGDGSL